MNLFLLLYVVSESTFRCVRIITNWATAYWWNMLLKFFKRIPSWIEDVHVCEKYLDCNSCWEYIYSILTETRTQVNLMLSNFMMGKILYVVFLCKCYTELLIRGQKRISLFFSLIIFWCSLSIFLQPVPSALTSTYYHKQQNMRIQGKK